MTSAFDFGPRRIGMGEPCFVIAEAGVNHNGDPDRAHRMIEAAAAAGADCIKFQTFKADRLAAAGAPKARYQAANTGSDTSQVEMLRGLELSPEAHEALLEHCRDRGLLFLSTPFEAESADFLAGLGVLGLKLPSGEVTNLPFLRHVGALGLPLILSTGMSDLGEVAAAVQAVTEAGALSFALLHCVSNYPANPADSNLRAMETLGAAFRVPVGYSDHTLGVEVALAAVALGACIIEKHFTLDRTLPGPDHAASLEPAELAALVAGIRTVESALGDGVKRMRECERNTREVARKSLVASRDLVAGERIGDGDIAILRPGTGLPPDRRDMLVGRRARRPVLRGTVLSRDMFE